MSDEKIISLLLSRKQQGVDLLYDNYGSYLFGVIMKIVKRNDVAELVLQDTFLKVWNKISTFDSEKGIFVTWLISIARNTSIDMMRSKTYKQTLKIQSLQNIPSGKEPLTDNVRIDYIDVRDIVKKLDGKYCEVLELIYFGGFTFKEAAEELNIPLGTVKSRIRKAYMELKKLI